MHTSLDQKITKVCHMGLSLLKWLTYGLRGIIGVELNKPSLVSLLLDGFTLRRWKHYYASKCGELCTHVRS
jgi:hypothetical protein